MLSGMMLLLSGCGGPDVKKNRSAYEFTDVMEQPGPLNASIYQKADALNVEKK